MTDGDGREISSVEILKITGISRATLNNYIRMRILPSPAIKRPFGQTVSRAKQMGYFPYSVLDTLHRVADYKNEGYRMEEICRLLRQETIDSPAEAENREPRRKEPLISRNRTADYGQENEELFPCSEAPSRNAPAEGADLNDTRMLFIQDAPTLVSFSVLAAELQDSAKICAEISPAAYYRLIRKIGESASLSFKKHFGVYGKHPGHGMVFFFLKDRRSSYLMNAISCALELKEMMKHMSREWRTSRGFCEDLYLNIGITEDREFIGTMAAAPAVECISLGDAVQTACRLSDLARFGSIWTTKHLLYHLGEKERKAVRFGIYRNERNREVLVENAFQRIKDLIPCDNPEFHQYREIGALPVTEIQSLH